MSDHEPINILMVDDQSGKLLTYEAILSELGENLLTARSAREALAHLLTTDIPIILIDVNMPELDGFELAKLIREHPRYQQTAIIFISAVHLTHLDQLKGYEHGAVDYITAPIIPELLRAKVRVFADLYRKTVALQREMAERQRLERETQRAQHFALLGRLAAGVSHEIRNPLAALFLHVDLLEEELQQPTPESAAQVTQVLAEIRTQPGAPGGSGARLPDACAHVAARADAAGPRGSTPRVGRGVAAARHEPGRPAPAGGAGGPGHRGLSCEHAPSRHPQPRAECLGRHAAGRNAHAGGPAHGHTCPAPGPGYRAWHPDRAAHEDFRALYTTKPGGSGLGLYIVQEIVAAHGGTLAVESALGCGTTFTMTLATVDG